MLLIGYPKQIYKSLFKISQFYNIKFSKIEIDDNEASMVTKHWNNE